MPSFLPNLLTYFLLTYLGLVTKIATPVDVALLTYLLTYSGLVTKIATPVEVADLAIKGLAPVEMEGTASGAVGDNDVAAEALIMPWAHDSNKNDVAEDGLVPQMETSVSVEVGDDMGVEPRMETTTGDVEVQALAPRMDSHVEVNDVEIVTSTVSD